MTIIAEEFKKLILDKAEENESESIVKWRNIILLNKKFECIICFRTTILCEGFLVFRVVLFLLLSVFSRITSAHMFLYFCLLRIQVIC